MNKKIIPIFSILVLLFVFTSGCFDFLTSDDTTTYEIHPTKVSYQISYGYYINCSGAGSFNIVYNCDKPNEYITSEIYFLEILYNIGYAEKTLYGNNIIYWNITSENSKNYKLGITASVESESFMVNDLNGFGAATLDEIQNDYSEIYLQYTDIQSFDGDVYINPVDGDIKLTAEGIVDSYGNNSFILAKQLFMWLKENTRYKIHLFNDVQTAHDTYNLGTGDCDDLSFLYISLCRSIGIPARFIRGYLIEEENGVVSAVAHAWVEVFVGGDIGVDGWIPVECAGVAVGENKAKTEVNQNFGLESASHLRLYVDDGSNDSLNLSLSGPLVKYDTGLIIEMTGFVDIPNYIVDETHELYIDENNIRRYI